MDVTRESLITRVQGLEAVLVQIRRMYTNPDLHCVVELALSGDYEKALHEGYQVLLERRLEIEKELASIAELEEGDGDEVEEIPEEDGGDPVSPTVN